MAVGKRARATGERGKSRRTLRRRGRVPARTRAHGWRTVWANQWEPSTKTQHAADCYAWHFGPDGARQRGHQRRRRSDGPTTVRTDSPSTTCSSAVSPARTTRWRRSPARRRHRGKKGVLWWAINGILENKRPTARLPRERRPAAEVAGVPARSRLRDHPRVPVRPRVPGRVAGGERRRLRVPAAPTSGVPRRSSVGDEPEPDWRGPSRGWTRRVPSRAVSPIELAGRLRHRRARLQARGRPRGAHGEVRRREQAHPIPERRRDVEAAGVDTAGPSGLLTDRGSPQRCSSSRLTEVPESFFVPNEQLARWKYLKGPKDIPRSRRTATSTCTRRVASRSRIRSISRRGRSSPVRVVSRLRASST